jgi:maleamate amidohydrolase
MTTLENSPTEHQLHSLTNMNLRQQYQLAGFGGRVGWGREPALIVVDMANAWVDAEERLGANLSTVLSNVVQLLRVWRQKAMPIFFTRMAYDSALGELTEVALLKTPHMADLTRGSHRVELASELNRRDSEPLIEKPRASAFYATSLNGMLTSRHIDTLVVTGCTTSGCIRSTCESAFNEGYRVIVPAEAVGDRSWTAHEAALFDIDARYGDVVTMSDVLAHVDVAPELLGTG